MYSDPSSGINPLDFLRGNCTFSMLAIDKAENDHLCGMLSKYSTTMPIQLPKDTLGNISSSGTPEQEPIHRPRESKSVLLPKEE